MDKAVLRAEISPTPYAVSFEYKVPSLKTREFRTKSCFDTPTPIRRRISNGQGLHTNSGSFATLAAILRATQVDIGLVAFVAALLYASPRDLACPVREFNCICMNPL